MGAALISFVERRKAAMLVVGRNGWSSLAWSLRGFTRTVIRASDRWYIATRTSRVCGVAVPRVCLAEARSERRHGIARERHRMDECDRFIDPRYEAMTTELPLAESDAAGTTRCRRCGGGSFEQIGTATVACRISTVAGFGSEVILLQASDIACVDADMDACGYRCASCGTEAHDLADIAESRPWTLGARALLPDGTEARVETAGRDRIMGNHREPTAVCAGVTYLLRDLRAVDDVHVEQLALAL
jgi:hypothetical protein